MLKEKRKMRKIMATPDSPESDNMGTSGPVSWTDLVLHVMGIFIVEWEMSV